MMALRLRPQFGADNFDSLGHDGRGVKSMPTVAQHCNLLARRCVVRSLHDDTGNMMPCSVLTAKPLQLQVIATLLTVLLIVPRTKGHCMPVQGSAFLAIVQNDDTLSRTC